MQEQVKYIRTIGQIRTSTSVTERAALDQYIFLIYL